MARRCLIIANQHYQDPGFAELPGAAEDAVALSDVLAQTDIGGFEVTVVRDAGALAFRRSIESFFQHADREDLLWLHLSCHGMKNRDNRLFLVATDTERDFLASTGIDSTFISDQVESSRSRQVVVFLDCCYSGAYSRGLRTRSAADSVDVAEAFDGKGRIVITASNALQFSHESMTTSRAAAQPSIFTQAIVQGLATGDADLDLDGRISAGELYDYIYREVRTQLPNQTPTRSVSSAEGTILLAHNARVGASKLPAELVKTSLSPLGWQRIGVLHELENLLGSRREDIRRAAEDLLAQLAADPDRTVSAQARALWFGRGLGELPVPAAVESWADGGHPIGIDFGTTNSAVAVYVGDECRVLPNEFGNRTTPSVAALTADGDWLVGERAKNQAVTNAARTFSAIKLRLGSGWSTEVDGRRLTAEDIAGVILRHLVRDAERALQAGIHQVTLTVPAYFGLPERRALVESAEKAGLTVQRVLTEPNAAALAYGLAKGTDEQIVMVLDLGGGTFDVSLIELGFSPDRPDSPGNLVIASVLATSGDNHLGGEDWDTRIADWLMTRFETAHGIDLRADAAALRRLREAAERAKIELSAARQTAISVPYLAAGLSLDEQLSRGHFEHLTADLLTRIKIPIEAVLRDSGTALEDVDEVLLVGGASRMPAIGGLVTELTGTAPRRGLIPDGVALGASIQAAVLRGHARDTLLSDAVPWSLGIRIQDGTFAKLIERNTTIPTKRSELFTTVEDNQTSLQLHVFQGEEDDVSRNLQLATVTLTGIERARRGVPRIEVTFDIDANTTVHVTAKDLANGNVKWVVIDAEAARAVALFDPHAAVARLASGPPPKL
ncbi:Hsp70 family protein [Amycolatopsis sp. OK19-0408]|uniref:Hsp70 family protein n=1 Tax=Amycolatopsis iheyensis TaxID=2945988 RepID=A0A9X2SN09_9PSEU|nr:Hsp70 family protein [Amycolatopsis iheyensis]MCR6488407.1 Hsp70 family protein [Amycolatopsis iheyensis]